jgi:hypothetical protein
MSDTRRILLVRRQVIACLLIAASTLPAALSAQTAAGEKPTFNITLTTKPNPPKVGDDALEVTVKDPSGKDVTDADVAVNFYMAAMPAMKMPEMKNTVTLKHQKGGTYSGNGQVMMAGKWDATVIVKRDGKELASKKFPVTAQ